MASLQREATPVQGDRQRCAPRPWEIRLPAGSADRWRALADGEFRMMLALESYARSRPVCWPGNAALAADCSCSEREVRRRLEALEVAGWIVRVRDRRGRLQSRAGIALVRRLSPDLPTVQPGATQEDLLTLLNSARSQVEHLGTSRVEPCVAPTDRAGHRTYGQPRPPESWETPRKEKGRRGVRQETPAPARTPEDRTATRAFAPLAYLPPVLPAPAVDLVEPGAASAVLAGSSSWRPPTERSRSRIAGYLRL